MTSRLDLTLAGGMYDRIVPFLDGTVQPRGINLRYLAMPIEEVFWRALRHDEFDAVELSLAYYVTLRSRGDDRYIAIPVFPSRFFRHGCVFVPTDSERTSLAALKDATVGVPEYTMTACVWLRGLLRDEYGIEPSDVRWRVGGIESPGRRDRADLPAPPGVELEPIPKDATLNDLLADGQLDAVLSPRIPSRYWTDEIRRLLPNYVEHEHTYYRRTGNFPIMHVVALRYDTYQRYSWVARSLYEAYQEAKHIAYRWLADINALPISLPWYVAEWERTRREFGPDPWADGIEANRDALSTLCGYLVAEGSAAKIAIDDLFTTEMQDEFVI